MALQKSITLPNGNTGNYTRISDYRWSRNTREAVALLSLYLDAAKAAAVPMDPAVPVIAKVKLSGATFDTYLSPAVLAALDSDAKDPIREQFYLAAKVLGVVSDWGDPILVDGRPNGLRSLFSDAVDV